jgi:hypothetical protein
MRFKEWFYYTEGQNEEQALKLLDGDQPLYQQLSSISPHPKFLPVLAYFHQQNPQMLSLSKDIENFATLVNNKKLPMVQITSKGAIMGREFVDYSKWSERINSLTSADMFKNKNSQNDGSPSEGKPVFSKNNIDVYESNSRSKCVKYGQGYSFCISDPSRNNMWQSYRDKDASTYYFVFDRNLPKQNPLHIVVVDNNEGGIQLTDASNNTGTIHKFGTNWKQYIAYLESKGIPSSIFKHVIHSEKEILDKNKLGTNNPSVEFFKSLSHEEKSSYIGRGHELSEEQLVFLQNNKLMDLITQYVNTGNMIDGSFLEFVFSNNGLKKTYLRNRVNTNLQNINSFNLTDMEWSNLDDDLKRKIENFLQITNKLDDMDAIENIINLGIKIPNLDLFQYNKLLEKYAFEDNFDMVKQIINNLSKVEPRQLQYMLDSLLQKTTDYGSKEMAKLLKSLNANNNDDDELNDYYKDDGISDYDDPFDDDY